MNKNNIHRQDLESEQYDLIIVGGGFNTLQFLVNTLKKGKLYELVSKSEIAIYDKGLYFGCDKYEKKLINCNTSALDLLRLIVKEPESLESEFFDDCVMQFNPDNNQVFDNSPRMFRNNNRESNLSNILENNSFQQEGIIMRQESMDGSMASIKSALKTQGKYKLGDDSNRSNVSLNYQQQSSQQMEIKKKATPSKEQKLNQIDERIRIESLQNPQKSPKKKIDYNLSYTENSILNQQYQQQQYLNDQSNINSKVGFYNKTQIHDLTINHNLKLQRGIPSATEQQNMKAKQSMSHNLNENIFLVDSEKLIKKIENNILGAFRELVKSQVVQDLVQYGLKNPPMTLVSYYLRLVGMHLLHHIKTIKKDKAIFFPNHEVTQMTLCQDGLINVRIKLLIHSPQLIQETDYQFIKKQKDLAVLQVYKTIRSKQIILNNGTQPMQIAEKYRETIPQQILYNAQDFFNDETFIQNILRIQKNTNFQNKKRVCIVGGGNSGLYAAHLLLHGPSIKINKKQKSAYKPYGSQTKDTCQSCCRCTQMFVKKEEKPAYKIANLPKPSKIVPKGKEVNNKFQKQEQLKQQRNSVTLNMKNEQYANNKKQYKNVEQCQCPCYCYGNDESQFMYWKTSDVNLLDFKEGEILIFHRKEQEIYFRNYEEYKRFQGGLNLPDMESSNTWGEYNHQKGLKGDARRLYIQILEGIEKRVKFIQYEDFQEIIEILQNSALVIEAVGKTYIPIQIKNTQGKNIELLTLDDRYVMVNAGQHVLSNKGGIQNVYGIGNGYSKDGGDFMFYQHYQGTKCLFKILKFKKQEYYGYAGYGRDWEWFMKEDDDADQGIDYNKPILQDKLDYDQMSNHSTQMVDQISFNLNNMSSILEKDNKNFLSFNKVDDMQKRKSQQGYNLKINNNQFNQYYGSSSTSNNQSNANSKRNYAYK